MFLEELKKLGYFEHDEDMRLYLDFPYDARISLASEMLKVLRLENLSVQIIRTDFHLLQTMCLIGQSFNLPISEPSVEVVHACVQIYRKWLMVPGFQPEPLKKNPSKFFKVLFIYFFFFYILKLRCRK